MLLVVPSAINPIDNNILINPTHPDTKRLRIQQGNAFQFDPRLFGK